MKSMKVLLAVLVTAGLAIESVAVTVVNAGFELPAYGAGGWAYLTSDGVTGGWTFSATGGGIGNNGSPWVATAPEGVQAAFLQRDAHMQQSIAFPVSGTYKLDFKATNRPGKNAGNLYVLVDGVTVASWTAAQLNNGAVFQSFSTDLGALSAGTHTVRFLGESADATDRASAIDGVVITLVATALYWNPAPLTGNWSDLAWTAGSGGSPTQYWASAGVAIFDQAGSYSVTVDAAQSADSVFIEAGSVTLDGSDTVSSDLINIKSGASLTGSGARYLKIGETRLDVDGTLNYTGNDGAARSVTLIGGAGSIVLGANLVADGDSSFTGAMSGTGGLSKIGDGQLHVDNSFTGPVDVQTGRLVLKNAANGDISVDAGAALIFEQAADLVGAVNAPSASYDSAALVGLYNAGDIANPNLTGADFADQSFLKIGVGTLTLGTSPALANVTGGVVVAEGTLKYATANAVNAGTPIEVKDGGRLHLNYGPTMNISHPLTLSGNYAEGDEQGSLYINYNGVQASFNAPVTLAGNTKIKAFAATTTVNINAGISGAGDLVIGGGAASPSHYQTFNFNAPSTFDGDVTLKSDAGSNADFNWGVDDAMPAGSILKVGGPSWNNTYAQVDFKGYDQQTAGIADGAIIGAVRRIKNSGGGTSTLGVNVGSGDLTYSGILDGSIDIVKTGGGTQRITGSGSGHSGRVAVEQGTLSVGPNTLPNADITVANGARLQTNSDGVTTVAHTTLTGIGDRGALHFGGGNDTWNGDITIDGYARIGSYGGGVMIKTLSGAIDGSGTLNIWAGGGANTHENVYVLAGESSFEGDINMEAAFGACLTVKLSGGDNRLPDGVPVQFAPNWNLAFSRMDVAGTANQRVGSLISAGNAERGRAVINSTASTTNSLTINTIGGSAIFEGVIGESGPCLSPGTIELVKEGGGAQIFRKGAVWIWNTGATGTNVVNADVTVNNGAIGFSGTDMLSADKAVDVGPSGALIAPDKATLDTLLADPRFTVDASSPLGLYDTWDLAASDPTRMFYYSGGAILSTDNTAALPNGLILAGGTIQIGVDGAAGDATLGPVDQPLIVNGTTLKNRDNNPVLSSSRTITVNSGGVALTAGWSKELHVASKLSGTGGVNINCDSGTVILSNTANDYAGDTTLATKWAGSFGNASRLRLGASEVIPHGPGKGDLILLANATLDMAGFDETVNALVSEEVSARIINSSVNPSVLTVGANSATGSYSGTVGGDISLVKIGAGRQTLTAPCSYTGDTVVDAGTLALDAGCTLASEMVIVHRDATLRIADGDVFNGTNSVTRLFAGMNASTLGDQAGIEIAAGVDVTVLHFAIDGVFKPAGTWGASGSGAQFIDDEIFTGAGILTVLETGPARGTVLLVR